MGKFCYEIFPWKIIMLKTFIDMTLYHKISFVAAIDYENV